jgi:hypothetical protein
MTPEAQRIAIAKACGWVAKHYTDDGIGYTVAFQPDGAWAGSTSGHCGLHPSQGLPDYLTDLNAMHEAESCLDSAQARAYAERLAGSPNRTPEGSACVWKALRATAAQRAEAFIRVLNLWID